MPRPTWISLLLVFAACAPPRPDRPVAMAQRPAEPVAAPMPQPAPAPPPATEPRFVLIRANATLYTKPDVRARGMNPYRYPERSSGVYVNVFRLLGEQGGWLELESLGSPRGPGGFVVQEHCAGQIHELGGLKLRLFVPDTARVLATSREVTLSYADGTSITLKPGVPLFPKESPPGMMLAHTSGLSFSIAPPQDAVGKSFAPAPFFDVPKEPALLVPSKAVAKGALRYGETAWLTQPGALANVEWVSAVRPAGDQVLATIVKQCARFEVKVQKDELDSPASVSGLLGMLRDSNQDGPRLRAGAALVWPEGTPAGTVAEDTGFATEVPGPPGTRCFKKPLRYFAKDDTPKPWSYLEVCARPEDVLAPSPAPTPPPPKAK